MPTGPQGQRRPADAIGAAVMVARLAIGEISEELKTSSGKSRSGRAGGKSRAQNLSAERRSEIARKAAAVRWEK